MNSKKWKKTHGSKHLATYDECDLKLRTRVALTLSTARPNTPRYRHEAFALLKKLITRHSRNWMYSFNLEVYDKNLKETKIHFHGTINYPSTEQKLVMKFITKWEKVRGNVHWEYITNTPADLFSWHYCYCRKEMQHHPKPTKYWVNKLNWGNVKKSVISVTPIIACFCADKGGGAES